MNPTRNFLRARAAAIVAQLEDQFEGDVDARVALRIEYTDLRAAMTNIAGDKVVTAQRPHLAESLWAEHCRAHELALEHDARNI